MKQIKQLLLFLCIFLISSCGKDVFEPSNSTTNHSTTQNVSDANEGPEVEDSDDDCIDLDEEEDHSPLQNLLMEEIYEATICERAKSDVLPLFDYGIKIREDVNMTPYMHYEDSRVGGLLFTQIVNDSAIYYTIDRSLIENSEIAVFHLTEEVVITIEEIIEIMEQAECIIMCNCSLGGSGVDLKGPTEGIWKWIRNLFTKPRVGCPDASGGDRPKYRKKWKKFKFDGIWDNRPYFTSVWDDDSAWGDLSEDRYAVPASVLRAIHFLVNSNGGGGSEFPGEELEFMCYCSANDGSNIDCNSPECETSELCEKWQNYVNHCLEGATGCEVDPSNMSELGWAYLMQDYPDLFEETIDNTLFCVPTDKVGCVVAIAEFESTYNVEVTPYEKNQIINAIETCDGTVEQILSEYLDLISPVFGWDDEPSFTICPSSFDEYTPTGLGYTIRITCDRAIHLINNLVIKSYRVDDLCITTGLSEINEDGTTELLGGNNIRRKQLTAQAWTNARNRLFDINQQRVATNRLPLGDLEYRNHFKTILFDELSLIMTGVQVSYGGCSEDVGEGLLKVGTICFPILC